MKNQNRFLFHIWLFVFMLLPDLSVAQGIEIESGASITITGAASIEITDGGFINNGTYIKDTETATFSGTTANTISGSSETDFYNLSNSNSGGITIESTVAVTVSNIFSNTGTFSINSDVSGSGSFITSTDDEPITVERYLVGSQWHIISPSASGINIQSYLGNAENDVSVNGLNYAMTAYDESSGWDAYFTSGTGGNLISGKGYLYGRTSSGAVKFSGTSKGTSTSIAITRNQFGWNCIGNPFTASIKIRGGGADSFLGENADQLDGSYAALYIFDPNNLSQYQILNNTQTGEGYLDQDYIQPGQGFLVKSKTDGGTIDFTPEMKSHQKAAVFYKKSATIKEKWFPLKINVARSDNSTSTMILFNENMTPGLDITYDAGFFGGDSDLKTYTRLVEDNGINFGIQCLPTQAFDDYIVPLGIETQKGGSITITIEDEDLPSGLSIVLEDKEKDVLLNMRTQQFAYSVGLDENTIASDRFFIHLSNSSSLSDNSISVNENSPGISV
jgi:hypothetical protein